PRAWSPSSTEAATNAGKKSAKAGHGACAIGRRFGQRVAGTVRWAGRIRVRRWSVTRHAGGLTGFVTLFALEATAFALGNLLEKSDVQDSKLTVLTAEQRTIASGMIARDIQRRINRFNVQHREAWYKIKTREQWEKYRDDRIARLRQSLGEWPTPVKPNVKV